MKKYQIKVQIVPSMIEIKLGLAKPTIKTVEVEASSLQEAKKLVDTHGQVIGGKIHV